MTFYLGINEPYWLGLLDVPLFVSRRRLIRIKKPPKALAKWVLDSGGFTELQIHGKWETSPHQYAAEVRQWRDEIGKMEWAPVQDWMCEPAVINGGRFGGLDFKGTGLSVHEHQKRTVFSYVTLKTIAPDLPWAPVLQGQAPDDYIRHVEMYEKAMAYPLSTCKVVGIGSICRRQGTVESMAILRPLAAMGLKMHAFGLKSTGFLLGASAILKSADSMAWSRAARYDAPLDGCTHRSCHHCRKYALRWLGKVTADIEKGKRAFRPQLFE